MVSQANVAQLVADADYLPMTPDDVMVFSSSPMFDGTTIEVWGALLSARAWSSSTTTSCSIPSASSRAWWRPG